MKVVKEMSTALKRKYGFVTESKKLLDNLPEHMRYIGKPEVLSESYLDTKLNNSEANLMKGNTITKE